MRVTSWATADSESNFGLNEGRVLWVLQPTMTEPTFGFLKKLHYVIHET